MNRGERELRVIGGRLRGRKWQFADAPGLRPTGDRVRETLFNWLQPRIADARCLDLFAGSGALGIEALSRGAAAVDFCESSRRVAADLSATLDRFGVASAGTVHVEPALSWLARATAPYGVVFLDPPFDQRLLASSIAELNARNLLVPGALVYIELPASEAPPPMPPGWQPHRSGKAGEVGYHLFSFPGAPLDVS
jgi:16S rRNA (guanine966-N2)-methyltransferase